MGDRKSILDLPNEITQHLFQILLDTDRSRLSPCLRVCKDWNEVGTPELWKAITLYGYNDLTQFYHIVNASSTGRTSKPYFSIVRSVNFRMAFDDSGLTPPHPWGLSTPTCDAILRCLDGLQVLSLRCLGTKRSTIFRILRALPSTLKSLEVDVIGDHNDHHHSYTMDDQCSSTDHFCPLLAKLIPQLTHFKICSSGLCEDMVPSSPIATDWKTTELDIVVRQHMGGGPSTEKRVARIVDKLAAGLRSVHEQIGRVRTAQVTGVNRCMAGIYKGEDDSCCRCFGVFRLWNLGSGETLPSRLVASYPRARTCRGSAARIGSAREHYSRGHRKEPEDTTRLACFIHYQLSCQTLDQKTLSMDSDFLLPLPCRVEEAQYVSKRSEDILKVSTSAESAFKEYLRLAFPTRGAC